MSGTSVLSEKWIFGDVDENPIGMFEDFDFLFDPEAVAALSIAAAQPTTTTCTGSTCGCTAGANCTTACGPITTTGGFCGC